MVKIAKQWYLSSSHGAVLFYIAASPDSTIADVAYAMCLTRRTVWGIIGDLRPAGMLLVRKSRRRHHYSVNLDGPFLDPTLRGYTLRPILGDVVEHGFRQRPIAVASGPLLDGGNGPEF